MQIELYNQMVEKEGTEGAEAARKAFYHAREATHKHEGEKDEKSPSDHVSTALIERVILFSHFFSIIHILSFCQNDFVIARKNSRSVAG